MSIIVQTTGGPVAGAGGAIRTFKGIPYAAAPVGPLRFKPPQPTAGWTATRDALAFGPQCVQPGPPGAPQSEDCLTANVWTPADANGTAPVLLWIHGGGYALGAGSLPVFDGTALARHGAVVITFNYRLNVFGFLAHPELSAESPAGVSGNYGVLDVFAALQWARDNARAFGGDPDAITIMGESAGAGMVSALLTMPRARGMFRRAIMQSAPVFRPQLPLAQAEAHGTDLAAGASLSALRALPAAELLRLLPLLDPDTRADRPIALGPIADGHVLHEERAVYAAGAQTIVPLIIGNNADEGAFFAARMPVKTLATYTAALQRRFGAAADEARALWPAATDTEAAAAAATLVGDLDINAGVRKMAIAMAAHGAAVYRYLFTHARAGKPAAHCDELPFVFGTSDCDGLGLPAAPFDATDAALSETMMAFWIRFATTGDPNPPGTAAWPRYSATEDRFIVFGDRLATGSAFRTAQLDFLDRTTGR